MTPIGSKRILPIDATRGLVMLFSCLAHFAWWIHVQYPDAASTLSAVGMVATPTFLLLSGAMVGMLCAMGPGAELKSRLFNRGLFLLTVGHVLIALSEAHINGGIWKTMPGVTVVDEIGMCTVIAAFLVPRLASLEFCHRLARWAVLVLLACWLANLWWFPESTGWMLVEDVLIGGNVSGVHVTEHSPMLQHLAIYALGLPLGHVFARFAQQLLPLRSVASRLQSAGALLIGAALALRLLRYGLDHVLSYISRAVDLSLTVTEKSPPSPTYLLFYGGCGLLLLGSTFRLSELGARLRGSLEWLAVIGRASLFVFVLQYFLYWTLPDLLEIRPNAACALVFVANVLAMQYVARLWVKHRGNRWLTFGIRLDGARP